MVRIAIDGPAGSGKSTLARMAAKHFGCIYVDTGAIYRSVGLYACRRGADMGDAGTVTALLPEINIELTHGEDGEQRMILNGEDVSEDIRLPEISAWASAVSAIPEVRTFLLQMQRELAQTQSVIMDGRDIGTVVLPEAEVKIFLTADPQKRAERRYKELLAKGMDVTLEQVMSDMTRRDANDAGRKTAPLKRAQDAVLADTSELDLEESFQLIKDIIDEKLREVRHEG